MSSDKTVYTMISKVESGGLWNWATVMKYRNVSSTENEWNTSVL